MIARHHDDLDARIPAARDGVWYVLPRWVFQSDEAEKRHVPFEGGPIRLRRETLHRIGEHTLAAIWPSPLARP
jgi:hypothetical protein